jgi:subtilisin family serine protease
MRKLTTLLLSALFFIALANQQVIASQTDKMTDRLTRKIESVRSDEFIRINITLAEQYDSQQLIQEASAFRKADRREYVINVLKNFSAITQESVIEDLNRLQRSNAVKEINPLWIVNIITCYATPEAINELLARDDIGKIDYDEYRIILDPNERKEAYPEEGFSGNREITWNVTKINAHEVWALGYDGEGVIVSVIDTGVNYNHADLVNNVWEHPDYPFHGWNFVSNNNNPLDDNGHGTHCAGTVAGDGTAGSQTGVAPKATIMCLKVLDGGGGGNESSVWASAQFSVENGAHVMSLSLGWQHSWGPDRAAFRQAFDNSLAAGVISSIAAGNEGGGNAPSNVRTPGDCPPPWLHPDQPATGGLSGVVTVGATDNNDNLASFSSQGPVTWENVSPYNDYPYQPGVGLIRPDIVAPGAGIKSLAHYNNTGYESGWNGTSMATPAVAGVMALMLQKNSAMEPAEMSQIIEETALVLQAGKNNNTGSGRIDALAAVEEVSAVARPTDLIGEVTFETGLAELSWDFEWEEGFLYFNIYRDNILIDTTSNQSYNEILPDYGIYEYKVTALHELGESSGPKITLQWGDAHIAVDPEEIIENLEQGATSTQQITIENTGQLDLIYEVSASSEPIRGNREYCIPSANCSWGDGLTGFSMGEISNMNNGCSDNGYGDFTDMSTEIMVGEIYDVTLSTGYSNQYVSIWIDFNKNEEFEPSEMILSGFELSSSGQNYTTQVTIPDGVESGETRMRVIAQWQSVPDDPCSNMSYGETEDYTVQVSGWLFVQRVTDTIAPGGNQTVEILFDTEDLEEGTYYGNVKVESNDPDIPVFDVPVTLNVGEGFPLAVTLTANPDEICFGETSQLTALPTGGTGEYTYSWTSDPPGFTSTLPNPVVAPEETTTYFVEVSDGDATLNADIAVTVNEFPEQPPVPDGPATLCHGEPQTEYTTSGSGHSLFYNWMIDPEEAGTIEGVGLNATVTWNEDFTGMAELRVHGINTCGDGEMSEPLQIMVHELPNVDLGEDLEVCSNEAVILDAGNPGASYLWSTGETTQTIMVDSTGVGIGNLEIWVEVTDVNECSEMDTILIMFKDCTGIQDLDEQPALQIYPNPNRGVFSIYMHNISKSPVDVSIIDMLGEEVYQQNGLSISQSKSVDVDLKHLNDGVYFLRINADGLSHVKKLVIQK